MNIIDRIYTALNPEKGLQRLATRKKIDMLNNLNIINSGYSNGGASRRKNSMKGFIADSRSPQEDIDQNLSLLRQRSRTLFMVSPIATGAIKTVRTNVVGSGLRPRARIDFKRLRLSRDQADEWEKQVESEFNLWAESRFCDNMAANNFYELQQMALVSWLINGDCFILIEHEKPEKYMPYGLKLHLIEADRVSNPNTLGDYVNLNLKAANGNRILNGVEVNNRGKIVAYHVCSSYPNSLVNIKKEWTRVEAFGKNTGMPNILQIMDAERAEQYRGIPFLSPIMEVMHQLTQYTNAELMAAVINGIFTVFVTSENGTANMDFEGVLGEDDKVYDNTDDYKLGSGLINYLKPGENITFADAKRPNDTFDSFTTMICKYIGAALEIPYEILLKSFTASYSASRAALLEAWRAVKMRRTWFANDFCQPIYELFLSEAVARGRIKAPGFFTNPSIKKAWCGSEWSGPSQGLLDPVKEVQAASLRVLNGLSTREKESMEINSTDFDRNIEQLLLEAEKMREINEKAGV